MQHDAMVRSLKSLKLHGMAQAVAELAEQGERWPRAVGQFLGIYKWVLRG